MKSVYNDQRNEQCDISYNNEGQPVLTMEVTVNCLKPGKKSSQKGNTSEITNNILFVFY